RSPMAEAMRASHLLRHAKLQAKRHTPIPVLIAVRDPFGLAKRTKKSASVLESLGEFRRPSHRHQLPPITPTRNSIRNSRCNSKAYSRLKGLHEGKRTSWFYRRKPRQGRPIGGRQ